MPEDLDQLYQLSHDVTVQPNAPQTPGRRWDPTDAYSKWVIEPSKENLSGVIKSLEPTINSEIQRYNGPKPLLRSRARALAVDAIKKYDPQRGAQLRSWVTTQLKPLSRYGQSLRAVQAPEVAIRQAAEVERVRASLSDTLGREPSDEELSDEIGISPKRIADVRRMVMPSVSEGTFSRSDSDDSYGAPGVYAANSLGTAEDAVYSSLNERDKRIFDWKTGRKGQTLSNEQIAQRLGVSPAFVSQRTGAMADQISLLVGRGGI